jgi:hypothetical protein
MATRRGSKANRTRMSVPRGRSSFMFGCRDPELDLPHAPSITNNFYKSMLVFPVCIGGNRLNLKRPCDAYRGKKTCSQ